jgi:hypothetical protein
VGNPTSLAQESVQVSFTGDSALAICHEYDPQVPTQRSQRLGVQEGDIDCPTPYPVCPSIICHGQVLLLSIAKRNWLISQLLVHDGDRQAPQDLSNLLLEEKDLDPDRWLTFHMSILVFLCRIANVGVYS